MYALLTGAWGGPASPSPPGNVPIGCKPRVLSACFMLVPGLGAGCTTMTQGEPLPPAAPPSQGEAATQGQDMHRDRVLCEGKQHRWSDPGESQCVGGDKEWRERPGLSGCEVGGFRLAGGRLHPPSGHYTEPKRGEGAGAHPTAQIYPPNIGFVLDTVHPRPSLEKPGRDEATGRNLGWNFKPGESCTYKRRLMLRPR